MTAWTMLLVAGFLEAGWAIGLKYSEAFTKPVPSVLTISAMVASMYFLGRAAQALPIGTAYSVWVGIGALGATTLGMALFDEPATIARFGFLAMLVIAIAGLKATS